jgi:hypothetical protein
MGQPRFFNHFPGKSIAASLFCLAAIVTAHLTYIHNGFVWLDHGDIETGRALIPLSHWWSAFAGPFADTGFYRPLVTLLHSIDASLWGINAPGFHCTNIALHCAAALAAPFFITAFFPLSLRERIIIALVFGLHPIAMLPAGGISFRSESLLALFTFSAVALYAKARSGGKAVYLAPLFCMTAGTCFSKETAFFYCPSLLLLWEMARWLHGGRPSNGKSGEIKRLPLPALTVAAALAAVFCLRWRAMPAPWCISPVSMPLLEGIGTRLFVLGMHLVNLVNPMTPPFCDVVDRCNMLRPAALCVVFIIGAVVYLGLRAGFRSPASVTAALIAISLFPALDLAPLPRFYSPHYAYLAVAPLAAGVVLSVRAISGLGRLFANGCGLLLLGWIAAMGVGTMQAGKRFQSDLTLFCARSQAGPAVFRRMVLYRQLPSHEWKFRRGRQRV